MRNPVGRAWGHGAAIERFCASVPHGDATVVNGRKAAVSRGTRTGSRLLRSDTLVVGGAVVLVGWLDARPAGIPDVAHVVAGQLDSRSQLSEEAYSAYGIAPMVVNSAVFAAGSTRGLVLVLGTRSRTSSCVLTSRRSRCSWPVAIIPLAVPGVLYTIAWIFLGEPAGGRVEPAARGGNLDIFSLVGMIVVEGFHLAPIAFLITAAAFRSLDPALEDAASWAERDHPTVLRRVTLPLARPALLAAAAPG